MNPITMDDIHEWLGKKPNQQGITHGEGVYSLRTVLRWNLTMKHRYPDKETNKVITYTLMGLKNDQRLTNATNAGMLTKGRTFRIIVKHRKTSPYIATQGEYRMIPNSLREGQEVDDAGKLRKIYTVDLEQV